MDDVFISYSSKDRDFVLHLNGALQERKMATWVDRKDIPHTAEWRERICRGIEGAKNFVFIISPDAVASVDCKWELEYAISCNKRIVPVVRRDVARSEVPSAVSRLQEISFRESDDCKTAFEDLVKAIKTDLPWVDKHTWLLERAVKWDSNRDNSSALLRGNDLREAEAWLTQAEAGKEPVPTLLHTQYILASRKHQQQVLFAIGVTIGVLAIVSLVLIFLAIFQEMDLRRTTQEAQVNDARSRGAIAINQIQAGLLEDGLQEAMKAASITQQLEDPTSSQAETALHLALVSPPPREHWQFDQHTAGVHSAAFSPSSPYMVTAGYDQMAYILDARTGTISQTLKVGEHAVTSAAFSPDGAYVVTSSTSGRMKIWDASKGVEARPEVHAHRGAVWTAAYNPKNGNRIVTAGNDNTARVWDAVSGTAVFTMSTRNERGDEITFNSAAYSPDGNFIITANGDGNVRIWHADKYDANMNGLAVAYTIGHSMGVIQAAFSPISPESGNSKFIVSASEDGTSKIWETNTWRDVQTLRGHTDAVRSATFSPDGERVLTASADGTATIWEVSSGRSLLTVRPHSDALWSAAYSLDGQSIVTTSEDGTVKVWDPIQGEELPTLRGSKDSLTRGAYSLDGTLAVTAGANGVAMVWDAKSGQNLCTLAGHKGMVYSAVYSPPEGNFILTSSEDKTAGVWDAITGELVFQLVGHKKPVFSALYRPDGSQVATASSDNTVRLWDIKSRKSVHTFTVHTGTVHSAAYSPDGKFLVTASSDRSVRKWNVETYKQEWAREMPWPVISAFFNHDGTQLVVSTGITARVLDAGTGEEKFVLTGHSARVNSAAFSPDGQFIVTSSNDSTARIWYAATGTERAILPGHTGRVTGAVFRPDGGSILTTSYDYTARQYFARIGDLMEFAGKYVTPQATTQQNHTPTNTQQVSPPAATGKCRPASPLVP